MIDCQVNTQTQEPPLSAYTGVVGFSLLLWIRRSDPVDFRLIPVSLASPQPKIRRLVFISPFSIASEQRASPHSHQASVQMPCRHLTRRPDLKTRRKGTQLPRPTSLNLKRAGAWALKWVACAREVEQSSDWIAASLSGDTLLHAFEDRAPTTLKKHHQGWRRWTCYCLVASVNCATPSLAEVACFLDGLAIGSFLDRGQKRRGSAIAVLSAMQFAAWQKVLQTPLVAAWKRSSDWSKEAVPLPLSILQRLEAAVAAQSDDSVFIGGLLLMCWGGLRWSDVQRLTLDSVLCSEGSLRGQCWRTKSTRRVGNRTCVLHVFVNLHVRGHS